ncbi:choice-of-anchor C family protein [Streptomyces sp. 8N616]|uniref:choice-of-anchor C family protein n=1 Tax=Streptomyces sp. 8N616 TaxID=3457414 RepID=UPI003FD44D21
MLFIRASAAAAASLALLSGTATAVETHGANQMSGSPPSVRDITGGSFESPAVPSGINWLTFSAGDSFDGWQVTSGTVDLVGQRWQAADGTQSVDLNGWAQGTLSQTFPTNPGDEYVVSYSLAGNPEIGGPALRTGQVLVDGQSIQEFSFDTTGSTPSLMGWVTKTVSFQATSASTILAFTSTNGGPYGPAIDNVKVQGCSGTCGT